VSPTHFNYMGLDTVKTLLYIPSAFKNAENVGRFFQVVCMGVEHGPLFSSKIVNYDI
jgi:hypothetical protein